MAKCVVEKICSPYSQAIKEKHEKKWPEFYLLQGHTLNI